MRYQKSTNGGSFSNFIDFGSFSVHLQTGITKCKMYTWVSFWCHRKANSLVSYFLKYKLRRINSLVIFRRFWKMTRFLKSFIKQKVFIPSLWYLKYEILSNWRLTYSKIKNFHWKYFELLAFEHVRLKRGHTVYLWSTLSDISTDILHHSPQEFCFSWKFAWTPDTCSFLKHCFMMSMLTR